MRQGFFILVLMLLLVWLDEAQNRLPLDPQSPPVVDTTARLLQVPELREEELKLRADDEGIEILPVHMTISHQEVWDLLRNTGDPSGNFTYSLDKVGVYSMSSQNVDGLQYIVNTFLEGYEPMKVDNVFLPLYILSQRKSYMLDNVQYKGREEVWQSSRQAFFYPRGDCEDHAIVLADWLIEMGEDARVVLGDYRGEGHAWVVLVHDGQTFLLESTQKDQVSRNGHYPLAMLQPDYHPMYMFNRDYFWVNTGSSRTTDYQGTQWARRSHYLRKPLSGT